MPRRFDQALAELKAADLKPADRLEMLAAQVQLMSEELKTLAQQLREEGPGPHVHA